MKSRTWKELPRPATPGPWVKQDAESVLVIETPHHEAICFVEECPAEPSTATEDWDAIAALPDYVAEVDRLRAWVEWLEGKLEELRWLSPRGAEAIRAGEWPEGRKP